MKLLCNGDVVCFHGFESVSDLTWDFAGVFRGLLLSGWYCVAYWMTVGRMTRCDVTAKNRQMRNTGILPFVQDDDL